MDPHFHSNMVGVQALMEYNLTKIFVLVQSELSQDFFKPREFLQSQVVLYRGELLTRMDDKLSTFFTSTHNSLRSKPPLLHEVSFVGDLQNLYYFLYLIHDVLAAHSSSFADNGYCIKWFPCYLRPIGSPAAYWWLSRVAENVSIFDVSVPEGKMAAFPFSLNSLLTVKHFPNDLIYNFADHFGAQKALTTLQGFAMGKLGVQQFNNMFNLLLY